MKTSKPAKKKKAPAKTKQARAILPKIKKAKKAAVSAKKKTKTPPSSKSHSVRPEKTGHARKAVSHSFHGPSKKLGHWPRWAMALSWFAPLILVILTFSIFHQKQAKTYKYPLKYASAQLVSLYQGTQGKDVGERIAYWSEYLYHNPKLLAPLGRGPSTPDVAPVFPADFNCTTYVETVAGLARSQAVEELADAIVAIRYGSEQISYDTRNHFPEADWIPNNETKGILKDITLQVSRQMGLLASFAHKDINRAAWLARQKDRPATRQIAASDELVTVKLPYIPLEKISEALPYVPQGTVINVVRRNKESSPVLITHHGFLIWKDKVAYFRHAGQDRGIVDIPLADYLSQLKKYPWRVVGLNFNQFSG